MNFDLSTIIALFYDYPIEEVCNNFISEMKKTDFLKPIPSLLRLRMPEFTISDYKLWVNGVIERWTNDYKNFSAEYLSFKMFSDCCKNLVIPKTNTIRTERLFEWTYLVRMLSEDLISWSILAFIDFKENKQTNDFVTTHFEYDDAKLQSFLKQRLYDVHAHIDSSSDSFDLTWIICMNRMGLNDDNKYLIEGKGLKLLNISQETTIRYWKDKSPVGSYLDMIAFAAILRYIIYEYVINHKSLDLKDIREVASSPTDVFCLIDEYKKAINIARNRNVNKILYKNDIWDYAANGYEIISSHSSPQTLLLGEHRIIYEFFSILHRNPLKDNFSSICSLFHLYLLIKLQIRREIIYTNKMEGLSNYQDYQTNYDRFKIDAYSDLYYKYALQKALDFPTNVDFYEGRIAPSKLKRIQRLDISNSLKDGGAFFCKRETFNQITLVGCISKSSTINSLNREYVGYRKKINEGLNKLLECIGSSKYIRKVGRLKSCNAVNFKAVGLDFAGSDRKMRPEVFVQLIRSARLKGVTHFTYHAGEDFYDLLDGLRTIDEIIYFLNWNSNCRLGHALALFTDALQYYEQRHHIAIVPKQILLDNLVWFFNKCKRINYNEKASLLRKIEQLYNEIGYVLPFDFNTYSESIKVRGDISKLDLIPRIASYRSNSIKDGEIINKSKNNAFKLFEYYLSNEQCFQKGMEIEVWHIPTFIENKIRFLQNEIKKEISLKEISIECCPTSNLFIGCMKSYSDLPTVKESINNIKFSLNTDSSGIFNTNLEREYALVYAALKKKGISDILCIEKLEKCRIAAGQMRFK